jgi:hypothetical protein
MVDRVYKSAIPTLRRELERLRTKFQSIEPSTDWVRLRIDPALRHARELERRLTSPTYSREFARLTKGVALFHADLVYLRTNVGELKKILERELKRARR